MNTPSGARETIRHGHDPKTLRPLAGVVGWSHNEIRISASAVLALLAGRVTQEELFKSRMKELAQLIASNECLIQELVNPTFVEEDAE